MDYEAFLDALAEEGDTLSAIAAANLDKAVPSCPDWDVAALIAHQGRVYAWVSTVLAAGGSPPGRPRPESPSDPAALMEWFDETRRALVDDLRRRDPDDPAWVFVPTAQQRAFWWARRQALETAVHRVDGELAAGSPHPVDAELAVEGLDEFLMEFLPGVITERPVEGLTGTVHLHATDIEGEWFLDLDAKEPARREHAKADTAVRGPASGLYLWAWNRLTPEQAGLEVFGDTALLEAWKGVKF